MLLLDSMPQNAAERITAIKSRFISTGIKSGHERYSRYAGGDIGAKISPPGDAFVKVYSTMTIGAGHFRLAQISPNTISATATE